MINVQKTNHGGKREGAGRPKGANRYGEATCPLRIPKSLVSDIRRQLDEYSAYIKNAEFKLIGKTGSYQIELNLPLYASPVKAGFPSPADDYVESVLDLNKLLITEPDATFLARVDGDSMQDAGIEKGDIVVVDKSKEAGHRDIVIAAVDNVFTIKRLYKRGGKIKLIAENIEYADIELKSDEELIIWGVVTSAIKQFKC